ncbi:HtaA domain-containing protein [Streptomyces eurocidicus]|uniref:LPXTG-motif cell wall-anchored protein n=1 Tax=Streptomyces eurocidicus TaxID=66423 RepID=A0A7W8BFQ0_STREU|nr:HtaA domain-containing protein [Streptomyces eurocidicus]MBB5121078.1 LPXTG-motif cell wall-anchored protein [Streptomyces eurocidicus]MBF6054099.1 LPXTG cell wall anchor domain-containing protein [Streptomyces eurocidicus]
MTVTSRTPRRARTARRGALAALAAATALGATAFAVPAHAADAAARTEAAPKAAPKFDITDGTLDWGVEDRFRKYVTGPIARGKIEVTDGAEQASENGPFTFSGAKGSYDSATHAVTTTFKGGVRFLGHEKAGKGWGLDLKLADFKVTTDAGSGGKTGRVTADVTAGGKTQDDVALAALDLSAVKPGGGAGGAVTYAKIPAKLTAAGAKVFRNYKEGDALDPVTLSVTAGGEPSAGGGATGGSGGVTDDAEAPALAETGADGALLGAAGGLVLVGGGAVYAARRWRAVRG